MIKGLKCEYIRINLSNWQQRYWFLWYISLFAKQDLWAGRLLILIDRLGVADCLGNLSLRRTSSLLHVQDLPHSLVSLQVLLVLGTHHPVVLGEVAA